MKKLLLVLVLLVGTSALAYIPPYWMILSRTADNHGRGIYEVDQDVVFNYGEEPMIVNEHWTIMNEGSMRLDVTGRKNLRDRIRLTYIYQNNKRIFIDENGVRRAEKISDDWFEPFFHFRFSKNIKPIIVAQNMAPAISLRSEPHKYSQKKPLAEPEGFIRLARTGGVVTYALGSPTPPSANDNYPGLWIEQDQFVVRKLRFPSQVEVIANNYKSFSQGLWLPREREVNWNGKTAKILLNNVISLGTAPKAKATLDAGSLNFGQNPNLSRNLPEDAVIREFYSRLR